MFILAVLAQRMSAAGLGYIIEELRVRGFKVLGLRVELYNEGYMGTGTISTQAGEILDKFRGRPPSMFLHSLGGPPPTLR